MSNLVVLERTFRDSLGLGQDCDLSEIAYGQIEEWDSVAHMQLVAAIESAFDIMMDTDDVIEMSSFCIACGLLTEKYGIRLDA